MEENGSLNVAPFSWFQAVSADPPTVIVSIVDRPTGEAKDTLRNILRSGEAHICGTTLALSQEMVDSSRPLPAGESEVWPGAKFETAAQIKAPRILGTPWSFECQLVNQIRIGSTTTLFLQVVHYHAEDHLIDERGNLDPAKAELLSRLGGKEYLAVQDTFKISPQE